MSDVIILDGDDFYPEVEIENIEREQQDWEKAYLEISRKLLGYVACENDTENTVCSPYSFYILLAVALNATGGKTRKEIKDLIAPGYSVKPLNEILKNVQMNFNKQMKGGKLVSSNGICIENNLYENILDDFKQLVSKMYDAEIFKGGTDMVRQINDWVSKKTDGMIPKLMDEAPANLKMCLMNAIAFDAKWQDPYGEDDIYEEGEFNNADGTVSEVPFMSSTENDYIEDDYFTGFIKDYKGGRYALMALLPKKENDKDFLVKGIEQIDFYKYYKERQSYEVYAEMPEFDCEMSKNLTEFCKQLGLKTLFTPKADFSGITTSENIMVDSVLQKAVIKVNRAGTRAAAVTGMICVAGCAPDFDNTKSVTLDRPFIYAIINKEYDGLPVFAGVVNHL